jgi:aminoglycoside phosphotransferase (APT) family kinase protein
MSINMDLLRSFAERHFGRVERITAKPLSGGLDSFGVYCVKVKFDIGRTAHFVAKHLPESGAREAEVYRILAASSASVFAPRLLGIGGSHRDMCLFLEWIVAKRQWPWRDQNATLAVLRRLAELHSQPPTSFAGVFADSSIESEIQRSAALTSELYTRAFYRRRRHRMKSMHQPIKRIADDLISIRRYLIQETGMAPLHGDMHSGNAVIRICERKPDAVLLDWGRARLGSPLEDVASWLQSLAYWEPETRRFHDTLVVRYLEWAGRPGLLVREFRRLYWLAAASNAMAGGLRYHLDTMLNPAVALRVRERSRTMANDWLRIIRRADEYWRLGDEPGGRAAWIRSALPKIHGISPQSKR